MASSWLWAGLLQRWRGGGPLALLNALLALATAAAGAERAALAVVFGSGLLFGSVFLSLVASTTALVRHNCRAGGLAGGHRRLHHRLCGRADRRPQRWSAWVADGPGGLERGFVLSAAALALGALLAAAAAARRRR